MSFQKRTPVLLRDWPVIRQTTLAMKRDNQKRTRNQTRVANVHTRDLLIALYYGMKVKNDLCGKMVILAP